MALNWLDLVCIAIYVISLTWIERLTSYKERWLGRDTLRLDQNRAQIEAQVAWFRRIAPCNEQ